jgi:hypothetical protein
MLPHRPLARPVERIQHVGRIPLQPPEGLETRVAGADEIKIDIVSLDRLPHRRALPVAAVGAPEGLAQD